MRVIVTLLFACGGARAPSQAPVANQGGAPASACPGLEVPKELEECTRYARALVERGACGTDDARQLEVTVKQYLRARQLHDAEIIPDEDLAQAHTDAEQDCAQRFTARTPPR